jgi:glycosyltransferase involved in cell wall biosynthesis
MNLQTISIALCTHNGGRFLREQLESIANQTIKPHEVIVCDDDSKDDTIAILNAFKDILPLQIVRNIPALKTIKNFERAMSLCQSDLIFLADQDDFWEASKLEVMRNFMENNPRIQVAFSNALLIDEHQQPLEGLLWERVRFWPKQQSDWRNGKALDILLESNRVTGCTMVIRKKFSDSIMPFPTHIVPNFIHDSWIALMASLKNEIDFVDQTLIHYRNHEAQQLGLRTEENEWITLKARFSRERSHKLNPLIKQQVYYQEIYQYIHNNFPQYKNALQPIKRIAEHYATRATLPDNRFSRIFPIIGNFLKGNYHRYQNVEANWKGVYLTILGDLIE